MFVYHAGTGTVIFTDECLVIPSEYVEYFLDNEPPEGEASKYGLPLNTIIQEWDAE